MASISANRRLNPPRRRRAYPRVVKRASDQGTRHTQPPAIKLANFGRLTLAA